MGIRIVADSSCDLYALDGVDFISVPLYIRTSAHEFVDTPALDVEAMVEQLANYKGRSSTACSGVSAWRSAFEGAEEICVFTITRALSGSYNAAAIARQEEMAIHPEKKIHLVDTLSAGPEITLGVLKFQEYLLSGLPFAEACREIDQYLQHTSLLFALKSVHNFAQNGRISKLVSVAGGVLGIQIVGKASEEGTLELCAKVRGNGRVCQRMIELMGQMGYAGGRVHIGHVMNREGAEAIKKALLEHYPNACITAHPMGGLCSYYGEKGGILIGFERE